MCMKLSIINFTANKSGLEEKFLSDVVSLECPELETQRSAFETQINLDKNLLNSLESKILLQLFELEGNILDDVGVIDDLNKTQESSGEISKRVSQTEVLENSVRLLREKYRPVALRGSLLYNIVHSLHQLNPMYHFSLKYFTQVITTN